MRFFFYGTLIAGSGNPVAAAAHDRLRDCGPATVRGRLHALPDAEGWYPALVAGEDAVAGRLYEALSDFALGDLARLDAWEDYDAAQPEASLYRRVPLLVSITEGRREEAMAYLYNQPLPPGALVIDGGDFPAWLAAAGGKAFGSAAR